MVHCFHLCTISFTTLCVTRQRSYEIFFWNALGLPCFSLSQENCSDEGGIRKFFGTWLNGEGFEEGCMVGCCRGITNASSKISRSFHPVFFNPLLSSLPPNAKKFIGKNPISYVPHTKMIDLFVERKTKKWISYLLTVSLLV